ncbi:MAG: transcription antitermination factor NusB [Bacillota bacterium]
MSRRLAREYAVQFLYSYDFNKEENVEGLTEEFFNLQESQADEDKGNKLSGQDKNFSIELIKGTLENLEKIDEEINTSTIGWKKERIAKVDLAILRLAVYEILFRDDIPDSVSANESIEISKKFSTEDSSSFVNGVIGKIIRSKALV